MHVLRPYQQECLTAIADKLQSGVQRQCITLGTGLGKTQIFAHIPQINPGKTLVLAHREKLLKQAYNRLKSVNPDLHIGIEQAQYEAEEHADIVIASIQTLGKKDAKRRDRLYDFQNIIIDECHRATAPSYTNILKHYGFPCDGSLTSPSGKLLLGVTATPQRTDGRGLDKIFQEISFSMSIQQGVEEGYLVDFEPLVIHTPTSLDGVGLSGGDYKENELAQRLNNEERNHIVVNAYLQHVNGLKALFFCANVKHCATLTELFNRSGVPAEMVVGSTPQDVRDAIDYRYANGITKVILGVLVQTEGYDDPSIRVVGLASPTRSQLTFIQKIGRVGRPYCNLTGIHTAWQRREIIAHSTKPTGIVMDFVDNFSKNSPIMLTTLYGLNEKIKLEGKPLFKAIKEIEDAVREAPGLKANDVSDITKLQELKTHAIRVNIWDNEIPKEIKQLSSLSWQKSEDRAYWISLNKHETLCLKENTLGHWEASLDSTAVYDFDAKAWIGRERKKEVLGHESKLEDIFRRSDKFIRRYHPDRAETLDQKVNRRKEPATFPQFGRLKQLGVKVIKKGNGFFHIREDRKPGGAIIEKEIPLTKGYAGVLISEFSRRKAA